VSYPAAATDGTPKQVVFRGQTLTLPGHVADLIFELPLNWRDSIEQLNFGPLAEAICAVAGIPFDASMRMRDAVDLVTDALRAYGLAVGEPVASLPSSKSTGTPSRPTSKKPTRSTSPKRGSAGGPPVGVSGP
jgi:hypothetical protein